MPKAKPGEFDNRGTRDATVVLIGEEESGLHPFN